MLISTTIKATLSVSVATALLPTLTGASHIQLQDEQIALAASSTHSSTQSSVAHPIPIDPAVSVKPLADFYTPTPAFTPFTTSTSTHEKSSTSRVSNDENRSHTLRPFPIPAASPYTPASSQPSLQSQSQQHPQQTAQEQSYAPLTEGNEAPSSLHINLKRRISRLIPFSHRSSFSSPHSHHYGHGHHAHHDGLSSLQGRIHPVLGFVLMALGGAAVFGLLRGLEVGFQYWSGSYDTGSDSRGRSVKSAGGADVENGEKSYFVMGKDKKLSVVPESDAEDDDRERTSLECKGLEKGEGRHRTAWEIEEALMDDGWS